MITAYKWHSIARTTTIGAFTGIRVEFGESYKILLTTSIDWGNAVISVQNSNLNNTIVASVRLRQNGIHYYLDLKVSQSFSTDFKIELYDNTYWEESSGVSDLAGATLCIIDDINSLNTPSSYGKSFFQEDENGDLVPIPKADGTPRGIWTNSFMSSGGRNTTNPGGGGGISYFDIIFENDPDTKYPLSNGVVTLPAYPTIPNLSNYITKDFANTTYLSKTEFKAFKDIFDSMFAFDKDGYIHAKKSLWSDGFLSSGGKNASAGEGGGGISYFEIVFENDPDTKYALDDGVVTLPAYPDLSGYLPSTTKYALSGSVGGDALNALKLGGNLPAYYATALSVSVLSDALSSFRSLFDEMFEKDADGHIHAKLGLYSDSFLSSGGKNTSGGSGGGLTKFSIIFNGDTYDSDNGVATIDGVYATENYVDTAIANLINGAPTTLDTLKEIADAFAASQDVITALNLAIGSKAAQTDLETLQGYFTGSIANEAAKVSNTLYFGTKTYDGSAARTITAADLGALTSHQTIYKLTFNAGAFTAADFTANTAAKTINIPTTTTHISEGTNLYYTDERALKAITGAASTIKSDDLTVSRALISNAKGKVAVSDITSTELGYLDGVTKNIQTQFTDTNTKIDNFIALFNRLFTYEGTEANPTSIHAKLGLWTDSYLSSGGKNTEGGSGGGLTSFSIVVNGTTYNSSNGVVTLPNYPTSLPASDVSVWAKAATKPTYTKSEVGLGNVDNTSDSNKIVKAVIDYNDAARTVYIGYAGTGLTAANATHLAAYSVLGDGRQVIKDISKDNVKTWLGLGDLAYSSSISWNKITSDKPTTLIGYGITDKVAYRETWNNFIHNTNEFTFAAPAYSRYIWFNYRTASGGLDGAITEYRFAKGAGPSYADIRAAKYIVNGGTSSQFLKADGSVDGTSFLSLSGGILSDSWSGGTQIRRKDSDNGYASLIFSQADGTILGRFGFGGVDNPLFITQTGGFNTIIHTGNYSTTTDHRYLQLSGGGTLQGDTADLLVINRLSSTSTAYITFKGNNSLRGRIGFNADGLPIVQVPTISSDNQLLIHSGNIGERALNISGTNARPTLLTSYENLNDYGYGYYSYANANDPENRYGTNAALFAFRSYRGNDTWQIAFDGNGINNTAGPNFAIRGNFANIGWTVWYRIATTSSNVASATKLQTARTIWGQSFNGTGDVDGILYMTNDNPLSPAYSRAGVLGMDNNTLYLGYSNVGFKTTINGRSISMQTSGDDVTRLLINSSGNVLIGTTTDSDHKLQVNGTGEILNLINSSGGDAGIRFSRGSKTSWSIIDRIGNLHFIENTSQSTRMILYENSQGGHIAISGNITSSGNISASGDIEAFNSSDARLKENITTISDDRAIDILSRLNPVTFKWNKIATSLSSRLQGVSQGFIAQEWEKIIPNASGTMWGKYKGIDYIQTIPYLTKGWQIHETKIERLEREVKELKDKLAKYESIS